MTYGLLMNRKAKKKSFDHSQLNFNAGDVIYKIGEPSKKLYLIHSGTVSIRTRHGLEVGVLQDGEIFGEVGRVIGSKLDGADAVLVAIIRGLSLRIGDANELAEKFWRELSIYKSLE